MSIRPLPDVVIPRWMPADNPILALVEESDIPEMSLELNLLNKLTARMQLARQIDSTQHKIKKENHERNWMKETAEAMEIELDSDYLR